MTPPSELAGKIRKYSILTRWLHRNYSQRGFEYWSTILFFPNYFIPHSFTLVSQNRAPYMTPPSELAGKNRNYSVLTPWLHRNYSQIGFEYWSTIMFQPNHFRAHSFTLVSQNRSPYMTPPSELAGKIRNYSVLTQWLHRNYSKKVLNIGRQFCSSQTIVHHFHLHKFLKIGRSEERRVGKEC